MASKSSSVFSESDRNITRLRKMNEVGSTKALLLLLRWLNPKWMPTMSFRDYLKKENMVSMKEFNRILKPHQRATIRKDPQGHTYDVSLLYILILWGNEGLADKDDDVWKEKSGGSLEFFITSVKDVRNDLMHQYIPIDSEEFHNRTENLRHLLKDMISSAQIRCKHVPQAEVEQALKEVNALINEIRDDHLDPKDFENYKKELIFSQQCNFLKGEGAEELRKRHSKYWSVTPVSHLAKVNFPVDEVYTDMVLERETGEKEKLELKDLLESGDQSITDGVIFVEGDAGIGKTTLTKKLLSDWTQKKGKIKNLESYDLVIHAECREHIDSFKRLLMTSMGEISQSFQGEDIVFVALGLKILVIIDGLDELNRKSVNLFKEILQLKKDYGIEVIVTSRPEAVEKYFLHTSSHQMDTKHIRLLGIPIEKREDFVKKYHSGMEKASLSSQDVDGLLKYLKRTEHQLSHLWRLPYNLTIVTILWTIKPDVVNHITTAPELHWEIHLVTLSKLMDRLLNNEFTQHLPSSLLEKKMSQFIYCLCRVSLIALANDDVVLPQVAYQQLENICFETEVPVEEMTGSFLKKMVTISGTRYAFPHKGLQDFMAALFIWISLAAEPLSTNIIDIVKGINEVLSKNAVPSHISRRIRKFTEGELKKSNSQAITQKPLNFDANKVEEMIENVMKENSVPNDISHDISKFVNHKIRQNSQDVSCTSLAAHVTYNVITKIIQEEIGECGLWNDAPKFQNMLVSLIGLFYNDTVNTVSDDTKLEVLWLLQKTGVQGKDAWLYILNSVKCDECVSSFISKQPGILEGDITITDSTLFAYISLIRVLKTPLDAGDVRISLDIKGELTGVSELLRVMRIHHFREKKILINDNNFREYTSFFQCLLTPLHASDDWSIDINIDENLVSVAKMLRHIKRNNFTVTNFVLKELIIDDSNVSTCITGLKSVPQISEKGNKVPVDINIKHDLTGGIDVMKLLRLYQFKIRSMHITDENYMEFTTLLKSQTPMDGAEEVRIFINVNEDLSTISELLEEIKRNNYTVKSLRLEESELLIKNSNIKECITKLKALPSFMEGAYDGVIHLFITEETPEVNELMTEIEKKHLLLSVNYPHDFQCPTSEPTMENFINQVFRSKCHVSRYVGTVTSRMTLPPLGSLRDLYVSVTNTDDFTNLANLFRVIENAEEDFEDACSRVKIKLENLYFCINCSNAPSALWPLPYTKTMYPPTLYVTDVTSKMAVTVAVAIIKRLQPTKERRGFERIAFPRAKLIPKDMEDLLNQLEGVKIHNRIAFPLTCRPDKDNMRQHLNEVSKRVLKTPSPIDWGEVVVIEEGLHLDKLEDWEVN